MTDPQNSAATDIVPLVDKTKLPAYARQFELNDLQQWHQDIDVSRHKVTRFAKITLFTVFGLGTIWGATAPLDGAIMASGTVITENRNRLVQNLEGGILENIHVEEGQEVKKGTVVATLDDTLLRSQLATLETREVILRIQLSRRRSEVMGLDSLELPTDIPQRILSLPHVQEAIASQKSEFVALKEFIDNQVSGLQIKIDNEKTKIATQKDVMTTQTKQAALYDRELKDYKELLTKGHVARTKVFATERQLLSTEAEIQRSQAQIKLSEGLIKEYTHQIDQVRLEQLKEAEQVSVELQKQLSEARESIVQTRDRIMRSEMSAQEDGTVIFIHQRSLGAVLKPGETLMEIFPDQDILRVETKIRPSDAKDVFVGQESQLQFGGRFDDAPMDGHVTYISKDVQTDERTGESHYIAYIDVDLNGQEVNEQFLPGNSATVFVKKESKTFFEILAGPLSRLSFSAFKG